VAASWSFRTMQRGELNVDPIQSEFFSIEALDGLTEALVRETIQNTLDAGQPGKKVKVRFWLSGSDDAVSSKLANQYFPALWPHLQAKGSGLQSVPSITEDVPFLTIEDFQTRGLRGSPTQEKDEAGTKNDFYYFWRNVGRSGKEEKDRGRWGLGKNVFPASSRINTFFGLTVRDEEPRALLMGQSVLKVHEIQRERRYPYGYFGLTQEDGFAMPAGDASFLTKFAADFSITRKDELGLSLVIPFPDSDITQERILRSVIRQYFFPILAGALVVSVGSNGSEQYLDYSSLLAHVNGMDEAFRREIEPFLKLAEWACHVDHFIHVKDPAPEVSPQWSADSIPAEVAAVARPKFENGEHLAFWIPIVVKSKEGASQNSHFKVFLQRDLGLENHRAAFIREGLIVTDAVKTKLNGVYAIAVIDDRPLATLLGDAENPAHTEWQSRSAHFKGRYHQGAPTLSYVKNSVAQLVQMLTMSKENSDPTALADVFFVPKASEPEEIRKLTIKKPSPGTEPPEPTPLPVPTRPTVRVTQLKGGFAVHGVAGSALPESVRVTVAYEIRRGNPFKRYHPADFEMDKAPLQIASEGATLQQVNRNHMVIGDLKPDFKITVTGFDAARDIVVRANAEGPTDMESATEVTTDAAKV
jgi:hypothetical protein